MNVAEALRVGAEADELVLRCQRADPKAWRELFDAHFAFVSRTAYRLGARSEDLDDICQEVFLVAFRRIESFRSGRFSTWLYRIVANVVSDRYRRGRLRAQLWERWGGDAPAGQNLPDPEQAMQEREVERMVGTILRSMAPKKREALVLYDIEGLSPEEVAERAGCRLATFWTRLHHARRDFDRLARRRGLARLREN